MPFARARLTIASFFACAIVTMFAALAGSASAAAPPTVASIAPTSGPTAGGTNVIITGTVFTGATAVYFGSTPAAGFSVVSSTELSAVAPTGTAGNVNITVTNAFGTSAVNANDVYTYLAAAPTVGSVSPMSGTTAGGTNITIGGSGFTGATGVTIAGIAATNLTVINDATITATTPAHAAGLVNVSVTTPGGTTTRTNAYTYVAPASVPTVSNVSPSTGSTSGGTFVTITGTNFTGASGVTIGGAPASDISVESDTQITATTPAGTAGTASVLVTTAGGTNAANTLYTYVAPPNVTNVTPPSGTTTGGTFIAISGSNLTGTTAVTVGGVPATDVTVVNDSLVDAITPTGTAGPASVVVTTPRGTSAANSFYTYINPPTISGVTPSAGTTAGGTAITITGTNLSTAEAVTIGGVAATNVSAVSNTSVTATTPAGTAGTASVIVTTQYGTNAANTLYTYVAPPNVTSVTPPYGSTAGGTSITITGVRFTGATAVTIGGAAATNVTVVSDTSITATTPAGTAGYVNVAVTTTYGTSPANTQYRYEAPTPVVTSISPATGSTAGGTNITVRGSNFTGATLLFLDAPATNFVVVNDSTITATTAADSAGQATVTVVSPGGENEPNVVFTYVAPPNVTSVSPPSGATAGGTAITITGTNLNTTQGVTIGGVAATNVSVVSDTSVTATTPAGTAGTASVIVTTQYGTNAANTLYTYVAPPTVTSISPSFGPPGGGTTVTITGTNLLNGTVAFDVPANVISTSATSITATSPVAVAGFAPDVTVTTSGGTSARTAADVFTYYGAPTVAAANPSSGTTVGGTPITITGTNFIGVTGVTIAGVSVPFNVTDSAHITTSTLPHAAGAVSILVTNSVGTNLANTAFTFVQPAPVLDSVLPASGTTAGGTSITISGTSFTGATGVTVGGAAATNVTVLADSIITATTPAGSAGTASVLVTTPKGTNGANTLYTYVTPAPTVTGVAPTSGTTLGGTSITITGTSFTGATGVTIGGVAATNVTVVNATTITATTPAGAAGTASVVVTTPAGANAANALYTYVTPGPKLTSISPTSGTTLGGTTVTITGANFTGATGVSIGGTAATNVVVLSATSITATTPAHASGAVNVSVTTPAGSGTAIGLFTYVTPAPTVTGIAPASGPTAGGTLVVISGTNLAGATAVTIGGAPATNIVVSNAPPGDQATVTATTPAGSAGLASVLVTTPGGTNAANTLFRYLGPAPTITGVTPAFIAQSGGTITIIGANFTGATAVQIGANAAASFVVNSATQITAVAPAAAAGTASISVTTINGTNAPSSAASVTYASTIVTTTAVPTTTLTQGVAATPFTPVTATGGGGTLAYALSGGTLPAGLSFATTTGAISGTPTATLAATTFTVTVTDTTGASSAKTFMLTVIPPAPTASAKQVVVTNGATPSTIDLTSSVTNASAIAITVAPQHGTAAVSGFVVTYTPNHAYYGPDSFTYTASSDARVSAPAVVSITIMSPTLAIAPTTIPSGATNVAYSQTFTTSGGTAPYSYAVTVGTLPPGLTLSNAGVLSGTPTVRGPYAFTISATDSSTGSGPFTAAQAYTLVVAGSVPSAPALALSTSANMPVVADLTAGATNGPFTAANIIGLAPANAGSAVISSGATAGSYRLTFTPAATFSGTASITYTLSNANGVSAPATITIQVAPRANLALDPDLRGLVAAQTEAAVRFAQTQISNVQTHLEQLHSGAPESSANGITATISDAVTTSPLGLNGNGASPSALSNVMASGRALHDDQMTGDTAPGTPGTPAAPATASNAAKPSRIALWSAGNLDFGLHDSTSDVNGFRFHTSGLTVGADDRIDPKFTVGADLGFAQDRSLIGTAGTRDNATDYLGSVYGSFHPSSQTFIDAIAGYGSLHYDSLRNDTALGELENGNRSGNEYFASVTTSLVERSGPTVFSPYVRLDALTGTLNAFTESGGIDAAAFDQQALQSVRGTLGARLDFNLGSGSATFTPHVRAELQHEFDNSGIFQVQYADEIGGPSYSAAADEYVASHLLLGVGADATRSNMVFSIEYTFNADGTAEHTGSLTVKFALRHI